MIEMKKYNGGKLPKRDLIVYTENGFFSIFYRKGGHYSLHPLGGHEIFRSYNNKILAYCEVFAPNIKDTMRTHNGFTFEWEEADDPGNYFIPWIHECGFYYSRSINSESFRYRVENRLASKTKEQAISLAKAMLGIDPNGE